MIQGRTRLASAFIISSVFLAAPGLATADDTVLLQESPKPGQQFHIKTRGDLSGVLQLPADAKADPKKPAAPGALKLIGNSSTEYDETCLGADGATVAKSFRVYRTLDYRRTIGEQRQESTLRQDVRRLLVIPQRENEFVLSPDGPLTLQEVEQAQLEVYTPRLNGLFPRAAVKPGEVWKASDDAIHELADMEINSNEVVCKLIAVENREGRHLAVVNFSGTVSGTSQDGACRQRLDGTYSFDLQGHYLSDLSLAGISWMLDANGKEVGKIEGRFVLTRKPTDLPELRLAELQRLTLEPTDLNTALLFDEPNMGLRFVYPRRWTVKQADARQVILDDGQGAGLLLTMEPLAQLPTAVQFESEARAALLKQKITPLRQDPPRRLVSGIEPIDQFGYEVENDKKQRLVMDYFVVKQAAGGATGAATFPASRAAEATAEVERIVKSLRLTPPRR